jgi:hypothetical protein
MDKTDTTGARLMIAARASTYTELSSILGITPQAVSRAFKLDRIPRSWIQDVAKKFNVSPDWIRYGDDTNERPRQKEEDINPVDMLLGNKMRIQATMQACRMVDALKGDNIEDLSHFLGLEPSDINQAILKGYIPDEWTDELVKALRASRDMLVLGYERPRRKKPSEVQPALASSARAETKINHDYSKINEEWALDLPLAEFEGLWDEYRGEKEGRRGWLQVEVIKRFPEFLKWLEQRQVPLRPAQIDSLKTAAQTRQYELPAQAEED